MEGNLFGVHPQKKGVTAEVTLVPDIESKEEILKIGLKTIKGKFVLLVSINQQEGLTLTGKNLLPESFEKMKNDREEMSRKWFSNLRLTGYGYRDINKAFEDAGAVGLISSYWSRVPGATKFLVRTDKIPNIDVNLEDYGALYRLAKNGKPVVKVVATPTEHGVVPTFNT